MLAIADEVPIPEEVKKAEISSARREANRVTRMASSPVRANEHQPTKDHQEWAFPRPVDAVGHSILHPYSKSRGEILEKVGEIQEALEEN